VSIFYQPKGHWRESLRSLRRYEYVLPPRIHRYGRPLTHGEVWYYLNQRRPLAQRPLWGNVCVPCGSITVGPETGDRGTMPLAETPIARSTRIAVSRQELFNYEAAPALARSPAFLVRHLFSGERASLRPELQLVAHGLHPRHAARHGKRPLNLYLRIHVSRQLRGASIRRDAHRQRSQPRVRDERLLHPGGERSVVIGDHPPRGHGRRRRRLTAIGERERGQHWGFDNLTASARQRCAGHVAEPQCLRPKYA
jgi:hypothetical protein